LREYILEQLVVSKDGFLRWRTRTVNVSVKKSYRWGLVTYLSEPMAAMIAEIESSAVMMRRSTTLGGRRIVDENEKTRIGLMLK